ncbi:RRN3_1 [Blepharisma stoltei]|uniref:Uncharacterized protein n=1 Tax=Blepharisma stoltei TaxID=1481888 RepID=A0AAU9K4W6_9CILI|nr:unnamed protein product [Blepharisma stoltei]
MVSLTNEEVRNNPSILSLYVPKAVASPPILSDLLSLSWLPLSSENPHLLHDLISLTKFILSTSNPTHIRSLLSTLLISLVDPSFEKPKGILKLKNKIFSSANELKFYIVGILKSHGLNEKITGETEELIKALFHYHPSSKDKFENIQSISIGVHKEENRENRCFVIHTEGSEAKISYVKAIAGFVQCMDQQAEQEVLNNIYKVADKVIELIASSVEKNPVLLPFVKSKINDAFPHRRMDIAIQKFFLRNILILSQKCKVLEDFILHKIIEKLIEIEVEGSYEKLDVLLLVLLEHLQASVNDSLYNSLIKIFEELILPTYQVKYILLIILNICQAGKEDYAEVFLSMLIKKIFANEFVESSSACLVSFLAEYSEQILPCATYLIYYCLRAVKKRSSCKNCFIVLKYLLYLFAIKPEVLDDEELLHKFKKLIRHKAKPLKYTALLEQVSYQRVFEIVGIEERICSDNFHLPFKYDLRDLKGVAEYMGKTQASWFRKKRRRGLSFDDGNERYLKQRGFSFDETKLMEVSDNVSSSETNVPYN